MVYSVNFRTEFCWSGRFTCQGNSVSRYTREPNGSSQEVQSKMLRILDQRAGGINEPTYKHTAKLLLYI